MEKLERTGKDGGSRLLSSSRKPRQCLPIEHISKFRANLVKGLPVNSQNNLIPATLHPISYQLHSEIPQPSGIFPPRTLRIQAQSHLKHNNKTKAPTPTQPHQQLRHRGCFIGTPILLGPSLLVPAGTAYLISSLCARRFKMGLGIRNHLITDVLPFHPSLLTPFLTATSVSRHHTSAASHASHASHVFPFSRTGTHAPQQVHRHRHHASLPKADTLASMPLPCPQPIPGPALNTLEAPRPPQEALQLH
jgi:hypothetical protein